MQIFSNSIGASAAGALQTDDSGATSGASSASSSSSANTATVSANDFLQLLVTELKNQDPTANNDPNEYINQLVQVNSLEQLISINQDLAPLSSTSSGTGANGDQAPANQTPNATATQTSAAAAPAVTGNLSAPASGGATSRIVNALGVAAKTLAPGAGGSPFDSMLSSIRARAQQAVPSTSTPAR